MIEKPNNKEEEMSCEQSKEGVTTRAGSKVANSQNSDSIEPSTAQSK